MLWYLSCFSLAYYNELLTQNQIRIKKRVCAILSPYYSFSLSQIPSSFFFFFWDTEIASKLFAYIHTCPPSIHFSTLWCKWLYKTQTLIMSLFQFKYFKSGYSLNFKNNVFKSLIFWPFLIVYLSPCLLFRTLSTLVMMLSNCGVGEDSWEYLGLQGDPTSQSLWKSTLSIHWKDWCWSWSSNTLATWCEELIHWKRPWWWERLKGKREGAAEDEMVR